MQNDNLNDPEERVRSRNSRLTQDDIERRDPAYSNGGLGIILFTLILIAGIAYYYFINNRQTPMPGTAVTNTVQQTPVTQLPNNNPADRSTNASSADKVNQPANNQRSDSNVKPAVNSTNDTSTSTP